MYDIYRERIECAFAPGAVRRCFDELDMHGLQDSRSPVAIVDVIRSAWLGECLVLQPYCQEDDELYTATLRPAIEQEMLAVHLKDPAGSQQIYTSFFDAVAHCTAIIADVTELNENVTYELGYAHARGLYPLLFTLDPARTRSLPIYLRTLNVHAVTTHQLVPLVQDHLRLVKLRSATETASVAGSSLRNP